MIFDVYGNEVAGVGASPVFGFPEYRKKTVTTIPTTMSAFYALYDAFLSQTNVTRNLLGYGSKSDGTQDTTLPIYEYVIGNPIELENENRISPAPLVLLTSGVHSDEKTSMMALYNFVASLFDSSNRIATEIRNSMMFRIVPLVNPWGYDHTTTNNEGRRNARGVNLNRNFSFNWATNTDTDKGSAAYSELETQALKAWLDEYAPSALFHIDFHNHGMDQSQAYFYTPSNCPKITKIFSAVARASRPYFESEYGIDYSGLNRYWENNNIPGLSSECYEILETDSCIVEVPYGSGVTLSNDYIRRETEFIGMLISKMVQEYGCL